MIDGCLIPSGIMTIGTVYRVYFVAYDPMGVYTVNATKYSSINLVTPPVRKLNS